MLYEVITKYYFIKRLPEEYTIRMEMNHAVNEYVSFMKETGAEYVGRMVQWIYFRKKVEDGPFDIFSDLDSKIKHLDRIGRMLLIIGMANLIIGLANTFNYINIGWINLLCGTLLMYALGRIHGKKEALERERVLHRITSYNVCYTKLLRMLLLVPVQLYAFLTEATYVPDSVLL